METLLQVFCNSLIAIAKQSLTNCSNWGHYQNDYRALKQKKINEGGKLR